MGNVIPAPPTIVKSLRIVKNGQELWLGDAGDSCVDHSGVDEILANVPAERGKILLAHDPDAIDLPFTATINLAIAGYAHCSQARNPLWGAPVLPVEN